MTAVILLLAAICLVLLEQKWAAYALRSLDVHTQCDHYLAEPGQPVTWSITVENHSRLPIPFVRFVQSFPNEAKSHADKAWWKIRPTVVLLPADWSGVMAKTKSGCALASF